ncbi:MAG: hypothetical protein ACOX6T_21510 [Myxococcales bacterium]|jgi:chaperonin GroEL (HSP60 family)
MEKLVAIAVKEALKVFAKGVTSKHIAKGAKKVMKAAAKAAKRAAR